MKEDEIWYSDGTILLFILFHEAIPTYSKLLFILLFKRTADVNNNLHVSIRVEPKYK